MNDLRLLIDANIIMDYVANREPFAEYAEKIIEMCIKKEIRGYISTHTITNLYYILRKELSVKDRKDLLWKLCGIFTLVDIDSAKLTSALQNDNVTDLEDCLQDECAKELLCDYIVTRNIKHFKNSAVEAIEPHDFLEKVTHESE